MDRGGRAIYVGFTVKDRPFRPGEGGRAIYVGFTVKDRPFRPGGGGRARAAMTVSVGP